MFDEASYTNATEDTQITGRAILDTRDAPVLIARSPYQVGQTVEASVTYGLTTSSGAVVPTQTYTWTFKGVETP